MEACVGKMYDGGIHQPQLQDSPLREEIESRKLRLWHLNGIQRSKVMAIPLMNHCQTGNIIQGKLICMAHT